jgi:hypothetical protein
MFGPFIRSVFGVKFVPKAETPFQSIPYRSRYRIFRRMEFSPDNPRITGAAT